MTNSRELRLSGSAAAFDTGATPVHVAPVVVTPLTRRRWFRVALWLHRWSGLIAAPFFLILCLTGSVLIFHTEVDHLLGDTPHLEGTVVAKDWQPFVDRAVGKGERPISIFFDANTPRQLWVASGPPGHVSIEDAKPHLIDMATGAPAKISDPDATLTGFLLKLHAKWFLGVPGELFGGAIALLTLVSLVSGAVVYAPYVRNMVFGAIRWRRGARIIQLDLHNFIGVTVLGWSLVVTATGVMLALATILLAAYQAGELKSMAAAAGSRPVAAPVGIDRVVAAAQAAAPDRRARYIVYPDTDYSSPATFTVFLYGTKPYNERLFDVGVVDAASGRVLDVRALPLHLVALVVSGPLHFGNYGGMALKVVWLACTWAAMFITGNGAWLWFRRKRSRSPTVKLKAA